MLTPEQKAIIKQTVPVLEQHGTTITEVFYHNMLSEHPELLNIFNKTNQAQGRQKTALAMTVLAAAKNIDNLAALLPQVKQIGHKHRALNIKPEHYPIVGHHLLKAIKEVLKEAATETIIAAWAAAYQDIADVFIQVEQAMYDNADWSGFAHFVVKNKVLTGTDICHFTVAPADERVNLAQLSLQAGQYITVKTHPKNSENTALRHYSLCSVSTAEGIQFAVRRDSHGGHQGLVSNYLHDEIEVGDMLLLSAPAGDFVLQDTAADTPLVLISAGVGITPVLSMLEKQVQQNPARPMIWVYACQNADYLPFGETTQGLLNRAQSVQTYSFFSETNQRIDEAFLQTLPKPADVYICGSMRFMETMVAHLTLLEHQQDSVHYEPFGPKMSLSA